MAVGSAASQKLWFAHPIWLRYNYWNNCSYTCSVSVILLWWRCMFQAGLFDEKPVVDSELLSRCLRASAVAIDIETETRWTGLGPKREFGLSYLAPITIIALAWREDDQLVNTALALPFDESVRAF